MKKRKKALRPFCHHHFLRGCKVTCLNSDQVLLIHIITMNILIVKVIYPKYRLYRYLYINIYIILILSQHVVETLYL